LIQLVLRGWEDVTVEILFLSFLSILKFGLEFLMNFVGSLGEIFSSGYGRYVGDGRGKGGMIAVIGKEGSFLGGGIFGVIEDELSEGEVINPIVLLVGTIGLKISLERLIRSLSETIGMRVVCGGMTSLDIESRGERSPKI
jgi:hypothetical protein